MQRSQEHRIDLVELKSQILKKIGMERSRRYFNYLSRFLNHKVTKSEFDRSCHRLLGRENLPLHNQLIRSILRNASLAKSPPPVHQAGPPTKSQIPSCSNRYKNDPVRSNGVLSPSPRKVRSVMTDRRIRDRPSPLGQLAPANGNVENLLYRSARKEDNNGPIDTDNGEEKARLNFSTAPLIAPLGVPASVRGPHRTVLASDLISCYDGVGLYDTEMLRKRMESIAVSWGLGGVSMECANTLNSMLDVYLKKLIASCINLVGARPGTHGPHLSQSSSDRDKVVNGLRPSNTLEKRSVSLLDFRVAMELNPHQVGEDWPLLRERISMRLFEDTDSSV